MRKVFIFILIISNIIVYANPKQNNYNIKSYVIRDYDNYYNGEIYFYEDGIEFRIDTKGCFNYNIKNKLDRYNKDFPIYRDFHGRITEVGDTSIRYNLRGNVRRIGSVRIKYYDNGFLRKVGHLRITYQYDGTPSFKGYINRYNRDYRRSTYSKDNYTEDNNIYRGSRRHINRTRRIENRRRRRS